MGALLVILIVILVLGIAIGWGSFLLQIAVISLPAWLGACGFSLLGMLGVLGLAVWGLENQRILRGIVEPRLEAESLNWLIDGRRLERYANLTGQIAIGIMVVIGAGWLILSYASRSLRTRDP